MMYRRPDTVNAAGIIVLGFAGWGIVTWLLELSAQEGPGNDGTQDLVTKVVQGAAALGMLLTGTYFLRGENWARWLYAAICVVLLGYNLEFLRDQFYTLVPAAVVHTVSLILLFAPCSNRYYESGRYD